MKVGLVGLGVDPADPGFDRRRTLQLSAQIVDGLLPLDWAPAAIGAEFGPVQPAADLRARAQFGKGQCFE